MAQAAVTEFKQNIGESQELFRDRATSMREERMASGQCRPFTIVNFNWYPLSLQGLFKRYRVPTPYDTRLPEDALRIQIEWDGVTRRGHALTIREPLVDGKNVGAKWRQGGYPGEAIPNREPVLHDPIEIGFNFLEHYSPIFVTEGNAMAPAPPKDARKGYGVMCFEGDIHLLERMLGRDEKGGLKEKDRTLRVPLARVQRIGKTVNRIYRTAPCDLEKYLERMFDGQFNFAKAIMARAQQKWNGTDEDRNDISLFDRATYQWMIQMGYAAQPKPGEKTWLHEMLSVSGIDSGPKADPNCRLCQSCRKPETFPGAPFCTCGAPIDTLQTYLAGYPVADAWLMALTGEQREKMLKERERRMQGFEEPGGEKRGRYKGKNSGGSAEPAQPAAHAPSTAMPGEGD